MRITIHIAKPFFVTKEQKIWKVKLDDGKTVTVKQPKKPECIVNTLTLKNVHPNDVEDTINHIRNKYGIKLKDKKEMVYVHPHTTRDLPTLSHTLRNHCEKMKKQALEYESKN